MVDWQKIKELNKPIDLNEILRHKYGIERYFNRFVFLVGLFALILFCAYELKMQINQGYSMVGDYITMSCPGPNQCLNLWKACNSQDINPYIYSSYNCAEFKGTTCRGDLCNEEYVNAGETIGEHPTINYMFIFEIFLITFIINHFVYFIKREWTAIRIKKDQ